MAEMPRGKNEIRATGLRNITEPSGANIRDCATRWDLYDLYIRLGMRKAANILSSRLWTTFQR